MKRVSVVALLVPVLGLAACSDDSSDKSTGNSTESSAPSTPTASIPPAPQVGKGGVKGALGDLADADCSYADGAWSLSGTLSNPHKEASVYAVRASVRNKSTSSVLFAEVVSKKVAPGKSVTISEDAFFEADASDDVDCVVSVTRKPA